MIRKVIIISDYDIFQKYNKDLKRYYKITTEQLKNEIYEEIWVAIYFYSKISQINIENYRTYLKCFEEFRSNYIKGEDVNDIFSLLEHNKRTIFEIRHNKKYSTLALDLKYFYNKKKITKNIVTGWIKPRIAKAKKTMKKLNYIESKKEYWLKRFSEIEKEKESKKVSSYYHSI